MEKAILIHQWEKKKLVPWFYNVFRNVILFFVIHDLPQICKYIIKKKRRPIWKVDCVKTLCPTVLNPSYIKFVSFLLSTITPPALTTSVCADTH